MRGGQTPKRGERPISEAHRWARKHRLFGRRKPRVAVWQLQLECERYAWMEAAPVHVTVHAERAPVAGAASGVAFPDGSLVWWTNDEELWGVTDPDGVDATERYHIEC